jgi:hypothetical protein
MPILMLLQPLWVFIKNIPFKVWATLALLLLLLYWGHTRYEAGYDKATQEYADTKAKANQEYTKQLVETQNKADKVVADLIKRNKDAEAKLNADIAGLRAGTIKLQKRFRCPTTSSTNAPGSDGGSESGLLREDAEFLLRESSRADEVVRKLQSCQKIIKEYNDAQ